jgi:hypothetical protein
VSNAATRPAGLAGLYAGWVAAYIADFTQLGRTPLLAVSRSDRNASAEQLRIAPSGSFESRIEILNPGADATSMHSPFAAL